GTPRRFWQPRKRFRVGSRRLAHYLLHGERGPTLPAIGQTSYFGSTGAAIGDEVNAAAKFVSARREFVSARQEVTTATSPSRRIGHAQRRFAVSLHPAIASMILPPTAIETAKTVTPAKPEAEIRWFFRLSAEPQRRP